MIAKAITLSIVEVLLAYIASFVILITSFYLLTKDIIIGLGAYLAFISWWGWPTRYIELDIFTDSTRYPYPDNLSYVTQMYYYKRG